MTNSTPHQRRAISIDQLQVYRGPNFYSYEPSIHMVVDLGGLEDAPTDLLPGFTEQLITLLPGLHDHQCSRGHDGGFVERLVEGTWVGHVSEHVALELQRTAGHEMTRGKTRSTGVRGVYNVIYGYLDETVATLAGRLAVRLVNQLVSISDEEAQVPGRAEVDSEFDFEAEHEAFLRTSERVAFGPSTQAILDEAISRDIPWQRLNSGSLVQLGHGVLQQRIRATMTSMTGSLAVDIASDKELTNRLLAAAGLPVPTSEVVRKADDAVRMARRIGYPVVLKPLDGNHGRGVAIDLNTEDEVLAAFDSAYEESRRGYVLVESFITGKDYRVLVVGGNMVAIAERVPAHVIGDGVRTVAELVESTNSDPRRGVGHEKVLTRIEVNGAAVELVRAQGFEMDGVPPRGAMVKLALTGNMSTGGISIDRTFEAHPDNVDIAEEAARVVGLDIAGIDFLCPDITQPVRETGGRNLRGQRGARISDAHPPDDRRAAIRGKAGGRSAVSARNRVPHPDRRGDRDQRQDHHEPDDRPHLQGDRPQGRHDLDGRSRHRRPVGDPVGRLRSAICPDGAAESEGRLRRLRGSSRRNSARRAGVHAKRRRSGPERGTRSSRVARNRHGGAAGEGQAGHRRGGAEEWCSRTQCR